MLNKGIHTFSGYPEEKKSRLICHSAGYVFRILLLLPFIIAMTVALLFSWPVWLWERYHRGIGIRIRPENRIRK